MIKINPNGTCISNFFITSYKRITQTVTSCLGKAFTLILLS